MLYDMSIINKICLSPWLVLFKYCSSIPRRMPGIYVSKDGDIGRQMKCNLTHMNKELHIRNYQVNRRLLNGSTF